MNFDFRVSVDFFTHHKTKKLRRRLGDGAVLSLLQLWAYAAKMRTDGSFAGMDAEDIELAAGWEGDQDAFTSALIAVGFLDGEPGEYELHDWAENNPWVAEDEARKERAKKGASARWAKRDESTSNAQAMPKHDSSNAPIPIPIPIPKEEKHIVGQECPTPCADGQLTPEKPEQVPYAKIIGTLNEACGCQFKADTQATRRHIKARWNEGWRFPDFEAVITSRHAEWAGDAKMCQFLRPETLFGTKFESYLQQARNGPQAGVATVDGSTAPANQDELVRRIKEERAERDRKLRGGDATAAAA